MSHGSHWLHGLRRYLTVTATGHLAWETAHLPLYTVWAEGTTRDRLVAVVHCTGGDILIALSAWALAVFLAGRPGWPADTTWRVAVLTVAAGLAYTMFSEWLNTTIRQSWAYSEMMPVLPFIGIGLSPILQWLVIPSLALGTAARGYYRRAHR